MNSSWSVLSIIFVILTGCLLEVTPHFAFDDGRHIVLNPTPLSWNKAASACNEMNGTLLTIYDVGTLIDIGINRKWIVWVGLRIEKEDRRDNLKWNSGELVTWSNWANPASSPQLGQESCALVITTLPSEWTAENCSTRWPSLCEVHNGTCHFEVSRRSSLVGFNNDLLFNVDLDMCTEACQSSTSFHCSSFEYNSFRRFCQLSDTHRWNQPAQFAFPDKEWNYYHRQCYTVQVDETWIPNGEIPTVTEATEMTTTLLETTSISTEPGLICIKIADLQPSMNQTEEIRKDVKELQVLNKVYKERRRSQSKESATDPRPSARYLGSVALAISLSLLLAVVILDLLTMTRYCPGKKARHKRKVNFKGRSYQDFGEDRVIKLTSTWQSSVNASPSQDHYSCPADLDEVQIHLNDVNIGVSNTEVESFHMKTLDSFDEKNSNSYVSWPYGESSPVLYPFHRSESEKADGQSRKSPRSLRVTNAEKYHRSKSDSFCNKRIYVLPESNNSDWIVKTPGLTKTEQLVMAYGHHFDGMDGTTKFYRSLNVGKLRRGSHC